MKAPKRTRQEIRLEQARLRDVERRFLNRNLQAMKFCNQNGLTVYAAAQRNNKVKVFIQHGEKFRPVNNIQYDQYDEQEVMEYHALIDMEYERVWKRKTKQNVEKKTTEGNSSKI